MALLAGFNLSEQPELVTDKVDSELVFRYSSWVTSWLVVGYVAIFVIGLVGNAFVVAVVHSTPRMRTTTNILLVNLAVADMLVLLVCVPANLIANILLRK
ncbi:neuropeptide FF receptor 2-like [Tropilaelaps mercedesae]|uniref:Neuropeptide FF receptor 2-like n=1 Tax=Tropilaelaps mercedesae TaxID=418985 RepID=A0A1V9XUP5_9ACAR|nr:neuropeptide FF receptor 2-like [Tropilaelaps mercedesae]